MIQGIGVDLVEINRIRVLYQKYEKSFVERLLTRNEIDFFNSIKNINRKVEWLSGRFAAKEAISKAVGVGIQETLTFKDIEILSNQAGKPVALLVKKKSLIIHLSITHTPFYAQSFTIIENSKGDEY